MSKKYRTEMRNQEVQILEEIQCDVCKKWFPIRAGYECEEFLEIEKVYGYSSKHFGDMVQMEVDICEACTYDMIGPFCRLNDTLYPHQTVVFKPMEDFEDLDINQR